jgi:hypothetical protein
VDPDHEGLRRTLSLVELERAGVLARLGRGEAAVADARRELAERRARAAAKPGDSVLAAEALFALRPLAEVEKTVGDPRACADYRAARREWEAYRRRFGISRLYADTELKLIDDGVAACTKAGL